MAKKKPSHAELKAVFERRLAKHDKAHQDHEAKLKKMFDTHAKARQALHDRHQKARGALHADYLKGLVEKKPNPLYSHPRSGQE